MEYAKFNELIIQNYQEKNFTEVAKIAKETKVKVKQSDFILYMIGNSLIKTGSISAGTSLLITYYSSIKDKKDPHRINTIALLERDIAEQLSRLGERENSQKFWRLYLEKTLISRVDSFFGDKKQYIKLPTSKLIFIKQCAEKQGIVFNISENPQYWPESSDWKSQFFLHIQRSGGISYLQPIRELQEIIKKHSATQTTSANQTHCKTALWPIRSATVKQECDEIINMINTSTASPKLAGSLVATHGAGWRELYTTIKKHHNSQTKAITVIRDHEQRLKSSLRWELLKLGSADKLYELINSTNYFDNTISHYLDGSEDIDTCRLPTKAMNKSKIPNKERNHFINAIDISDINTIDLIKSAYLSSNQMPNILQFRKINEARPSDSRKTDENINEIIRIAYQKCMKKGYLDMDKKIDYESLYSRTSKQIIGLKKKKIPEYTLLHPYTYDQISKKIIPTAHIIRRYLSN